MIKSITKTVSILLIASVGCKNSTENATTSASDTGKLSTSVVNNPLTADGMDNVAAEQKPMIAFTDTVHEFGTVHEGEMVQHEFSFVNTGKTPLIITSAEGSCGCTVPQYPHDPIKTGDSGIIKVSFNSAGKAGHQEKSVALHTNTLRGVHMLFIKAEVEKRKEK